MNKAVVSLSGGQDSSTVLGYALRKFDYVETMGFFYGQKNSVEMITRRDVLKGYREQFPELGKKLGPDHVLDISSLASIAVTPLTGGKGEFINDGVHESTAVVPARNLIFLGYAASLACSIGANTILIGVAQADYSGYPDCRPETIAAMQKAIALGCARDIKIETPVIHLSKAQEWAFAEEIGGPQLVDFLVKTTHTCYAGDHEHLHAWGYGCGKCPACKMREEGFSAYMRAKNAHV